MTQAWDGQGMARQHTRGPRQGGYRLTGYALLFLSVMVACLGLVHHDHDALCTDRQHACHTPGCWGIAQAHHKQEVYTR